MHIPTIPILAIVDLTAAATLPRRQVVPHYPPSSVSTGFKFIANVTDPSRDLTPSVDGYVLSGVHIGPPFNAAVLNPQSPTAGRLFYHNGTAEEVRFGRSGVVTDGGTPPFPWAINVQSRDEWDAPANPGFHAVFINGGASKDVGIAAFPDPYAYLVNRQAGPGGTFIACNNTVQYYGRKFITVDYVYPETDPTTQLPVAAVPEGCAPIALIPQCDVLNGLPENSTSSHEFAVEQKCYADVAAIDWSLYGP